MKKPPEMMYLAFRKYLKLLKLIKLKNERFVDFPIKIFDSNSEIMEISCSTPDLNRFSISNPISISS